MLVPSVRIEVNGELAWQNATQTGAPPVVSLEDGSSVQGEIDRWQRPNVEFFERLAIPNRILDPAKKNGLGVTQVSNQGLVVQ